jgi:hypothetical protein
MGSLSRGGLEERQYPMKVNMTVRRTVLGLVVELWGIVRPAGAQTCQLALLGSGWNGPNDLVPALTVFDDGTGPALYAGGEFVTAGGELALRAARWNGAQWAGVGAGTNNAVFALTSFDDGT